MYENVKSWFKDILNRHIVIFILTLFIALLSGIIYYNENLHNDETYYFNAAMLIRENFKNLLFSPRIGITESLNAIFQGLIFYIPGNDFLNVYSIQIIIYSITALFIFKLSEKLTGSIGALIVLVFYLINHNHWVHIYNFKPGVWVNFFLILTVYYSYLILQQPEKGKNFILMGIFAALLLLTDLRYLPHILFLYFMFLFSRIVFFDKVKYIGISTLILLAIITPWVLRQSLVFNKFIFISDLNSITVHRAFNTKHFRSLSVHSPELTIMEEEDFQNRFWNLCDSLKLTPGELIYARGEAKRTVFNTATIPLSEKYRDLIDNNIFTEEEISAIIAKEEKRPYFLKLSKKAGLLWAPVKFNYSFDPLSTYKKFYPPASFFNNINRILTLGILLPFFIIGLYLLVKKKCLFGISLAGILLIHTIVHVLTYVQWRYLLPVLPLITIIAVYGFKKVFDIIKVHSPISN